MVDRKYVLLDVDKLSDLEREIILVLGDNIHNQPAIPIKQSFLRLISKTIELLKNEHTEGDIYFGLLLLSLKEVVCLRTNTDIKERDTSNAIFNNISEFDLLENIIFRLKINLEVNKKFLKDEVLVKIYDRQLHNKEVKAFLEILESKMHESSDEVFKSSLKKFHKKIEERYSEIDASIQTDQVENDFEKKHNEIRDFWFLTEMFMYLYKFEPDKILEELIKKYFDINKVRRATFVFLTYYVYGTNGLQLFNYYYYIQLENRLIAFKEVEFKINREIDKNKDIDDRINKSLLKNIEAISIFVAIITLIIGNVSVVPKIEGATLFETISPIMLINGSLLAGVSALVLLISKIVVREKTKLGIAGWLALGIAGLLLAGGIVIAFLNVKA